uniref:Transthyretin-like protein 46 n=1 Tax=Romanomermis culicivorax TaxID=13658 RepID=A0A915KQL5_ROMCU
MAKVAVCLLLICCLALTLQAAKECLTVRGRVRCSSNVPIFIQLVDEDGTSSNDLMDETYPSKISGAFQASGCASDPVGHIDPELHIYHKCKGNELKKVKLILPVLAINKEYNYTDVIDLSGPFSSEEKVKKFPSSAKPCAGLGVTKKPK